MSATKTTKAPTPKTKINMADLWQEAVEDHAFQFEIKAQNVASDLVRAISEAGLTQAQVAEKLEWKPSRVSRVLHHSTNVTLRTLCEFANALDLEFDITYRTVSQRRAPQPWEIDVSLKHAASICQKIDVLYESAKEKHKVSDAILKSASEINRRTWALASQIRNSTSYTEQVEQPDAA